MLSVTGLNHFYYGLYILMQEFRQYRLHIAMHAPPY